MEDQKTGDHWQSKDQRANTRTTYFESDVDSLAVSKRRKRTLKRILKRQEGQHVNSEKYDSRGQQNHNEDKRRMARTLAGQADLTASQRDRVEHLITDVLSITSFGQYSTEQVVLGTVNVVAREDGRWIEDEPQFHDLMSDVGIESLDTIKRLRGLVRDRLPSK